MQRSVAALEAEMRAERLYGYKRDVTTQHFVMPGGYLTTPVYALHYTNTLK
jgi:hypothetical protein